MGGAIGCEDWHPNVSESINWKSRVEVESAMDAEAEGCHPNPQ